MSSFSTDRCSVSPLDQHYPRWRRTLPVCRGQHHSPLAVRAVPGDVISDVQWLYNGESDELIAMVGHGHFLPMPAFAGTRVEQLTNAGIVVNTAAVSDTGNYTVEVQGYDTSGFHFILHQTVVVHISGKVL